MNKHTLAAPPPPILLRVLFSGKQVSTAVGCVFKRGWLVVALILVGSSTVTALNAFFLRDSWGFAHFAKRERKKKGKRVPFTA